MTTDQPLGSDARACQDVEECHLTDPHVQQILDREAADLHGRFTGIFSPETVRGMVLACFTELTARSIVHVHLPVLAQRFARERLEIIAKNEGTIVPNVPEVLFVCVHNAGRSQMAAALLHHHAKGRVVVRSAGSAPAERINPAVVEVMAELGLDLSRGFPKP
ncbi:MAG: three-helix bundle dimerization domain-containing protein, partial [Haloechinothrix sp.]